MFCKVIFYGISFIILLLAISLYLIVDHTYFEVEITDPNSNAKCMDGSNYKFLYSKGFGNGTNSFYIYFEPGGFCGDENYDPNNPNTAYDLCETRTRSRLGSNKFNFISRYFNKYFARFMGTSRYFNPLFYNWNKVFIKYCDGSLYAGNVKEPIIYNDTAMYVRGEENVKEVFKYLTINQSLHNAKNVFASGSSAGGLAVVLYSKYIRSLLSNSTKFKVLSDSGFFIDTNLTLLNDNKNVIREMMTRLTKSFKLTKTKTMLDICTNDTNLKFFDCLIPKNFIFNFHKDYDILFLTSSFDAWSVSRILRTRCFYNSKKVYDDCSQREKDKFEEFSKQAITEMKYIINNDKDKRLKAWMPKGFFHTFIYHSWTWDNPLYSVEGYTVNKIIHDWNFDLLDKNKFLYIEHEVKKHLIDFYWVINNNKYLFKLYKKENKKKQKKNSN